MSLRPLLSVVCAGALVVCARPSRATPADDVALMGKLDVYWGTTGSYPDDPSLSRRERMRRFLAERMQRPDFYDAVLPRLFESLSNMQVNAPFKAELALHHDGADAYYSLGPPCDKRQRVAVHPWWDVKSTVRVCSAAYTPDVLTDPKIEERTYCEAAISTGCGCGPNLAACAPDDERFGAVIEGSREEIVRTMERLMRQHLPFSELLTTNATVRSDWGDFVYARAQMYAGKPFTWRPRSTDATLRPRPPEYQGGILTMPYVLWYQDVARRVVMSRIWSDFLCTPLRSSNVDAHQMFDVTDVRLRSHSHMELAHKPGCRDCHARLENAYQATAGFTAYSGFRFVSADVIPERSVLYVRDSTDRRAEGESSPAWLGSEIAKQPEFAACMVDKTERFFFGDDRPSDATHRELTAAYGARQDFGALLEAAFLARYATEHAEQGRR